MLLIVNLRYIFLFVCFGQWAFSFGQQALHAPFLPYQVSGQFAQPALLAQDSFHFARLGLTTDYGILTREISLGDLPLQDNFLDEAEKAQLINKSGADNRLLLSLNYGGILNIRIKKLPLSISWKSHSSFYLHFNSPNTLKLILNGNAAYAGEALSDEGIATRSIQYQELGIGSAFSLGKFDIGGRIKLLSGIYMNGLDELSYTLETATYGTSIQLQSDYNWFRSQKSGRDGLGFGLDAGIIYKPKPKWKAQLAVRDVGFIKWQGIRYDNSINLNYEGAFISDIGNLNFSNTSDFFTIDTLRSQFIPDSTVGSFNYTMAGTAHAGLSYQAGSKSTIWLMAYLGFNQFAPNAGFPLISAGYHREIGKYLKLGVNAYGGGMDNYGMGAMAQLHFLIAKKYRLGAVYQLDRALGLIAPQTGSGLSMQGGMSLGW